MLARISQDFASSSLSGVRMQSEAFFGSEDNFGRTTKAKWDTGRIQPPPNMATSRLAVSAFIICLNEEDYLKNCIESLAEFAEIVIVDCGSTDGTLRLIQTFVTDGWPIRLFHQPWRGYAGQKQFALEQCKQPWCFNIDCDERLDVTLRKRLPDLLNASADIVGWRVARRPYLIGFGYTPAHVRERKSLRLIRKGSGSYDLAQSVHEGIVTNGKVRNAKLGSLLHYRPLIMDEQILKENKYSTLKADQHVASGKRARSVKLVCNPPLYFLRLYFRNGLWRCGMPGFIEAMTGAVYAFLTQAKIYQRQASKLHPSMDDVCTTE